MRWFAPLILAWSLGQPQAVDTKAIDAMLDKGFAILSSGAFPEMVQLGQDALKLSTAAADEFRIARSHILIGAAYAGQGRVKEALTELVDGYQRAQKFDDIPLRMLAATGLANALRIDGRADEALTKYAEWRELNRRLPTPESETRILRAIGIAYYQMSDIDRADEFYTQALAGARASGDLTLQAGILLSKLAVEKTRKNYTLAMALGNEGLALARQINSKSLQAEILNSMGSGYAQMNDYDKAAESLRAALEIATEINYQGVINQARSRLGELAMTRGHYEEAIVIFKDTADAMAKMGNNPFMRYTIETAWAQAAQQLGRIDEAVLHFDNAMSMIEELERNAVPTELSRAFPISARRDIFEEAAGLLFDAGRVSAALETADRSRARAFLDVLRESRLDAQPLQLATVRSIQQHLAEPGSVLIEYLLGEKRSLVWVVTRDRVEVAALPGRDAIQALAAAERDALEQPVSSLTAASAGKAARAREEKLYQVLIAPVEHALQSATRVVIVPDGALAYIPFDSFRNARTGQFLVERFPITYAQSAAAHLNITQQPAPQPAPPKTLVAFGDPVYGSDVTTIREGTRGDWTAIPGSRAEVLGISKGYASASKTLRLGDAATESALKQTDLGQYRYVHFAVHGFADEENPAKSGLALAKESSGTEDSLLRMDEIARLKLNAELVTLSACRTATGKLLGGEGLLSLSRAFFYAGARSVVASLWNVNDQSTARLMTDFYAQLDKGQPVSEALRQARLRMLRGTNRAWQQPHAWAAFVAMQ